MNMKLYENFEFISKIFRKNYNCVHTLNGHINTVLCLQINDKFTLASGSGDNTIKIWDLRNNNCIKTLNCHSNYVIIDKN
ncbi:WD-40 repeat-containing [Brachionus plicatilis]|uniref:WD-40 repeat-containing n=1 Tax=Brachionus plicatilis TaxID=10195 RepID=A0A3M7PRY0_BRAPC|nr:WD-40 repeat-containing [Brachionus plicatilis]